MIHGNEITGNSTDRDRQLFFKIHDLLWQMPTRDKAPEKYKRIMFECHSICRGLFLELKSEGIQYVDGVYIGCKVKDGEYSLFTSAHSWLTTPDGSIIDPYPVAIFSLSPLLVIAKGTLEACGSGLYYPDPETTSKISNRDMWRKSRVFQSLLHLPPSKP